MKKYGMLMFSILALVGSFFPVAKAGMYSASIFNVGGVSYLLYAVPLAAIALSIITLYKNGVQHIKKLFGVIAGIGIGTCVYAIYQGMELLKYIGTMAKQDLSAIPAGGGWMMLLGYCGIIAYLRAGIFDASNEEEKKIEELIEKA